MSNRRRFPWQLNSDGDDDSRDIVEQVMELEEKFDITIPDDVAETIHTVAEAIRYLEKRRSES